MQGRLIALSLLAVAACSGDPEIRGGPSVATNAPAGPDPIVLRVPRGGGNVTAFRYPDLDSTVWTSTEETGAPTAVLAFDPENGLLALVDRNGYASWVDLRVGHVSPSSRTRLARVASADAWSVYGVVRDTSVRRTTPTGDWSFAPGGDVLRLYPQTDGDLVVLATRDGEGSRLLRLRPPESTISDSAVVPSPLVSAMSPLGDRLYLATGRDLTAYDANTFREMSRTTYEADIVAMALTPSGDRLFVATVGDHLLHVLDRYSGEHRATIPLGGPVRQLRMDPLGRFVLAQPDSADSAWVVSVGTNTVVDTVHTAWRNDLPTVASDGSVVAVVGNDVEFLTPGEPRPRHVIDGGAREFWHFVFWNGFRPRAEGLDQPVIFPEDSSAFVFQPPRDSVAPVAPPTVDTAPAQPAVAARDTAARAAVPAGQVWTVSFATVLSEERARRLADSISIDGQKPRVVVSTTNNVNLYRVVMGPYPSRREAERIGQASRRSHWVFEGMP